MLYRFYDFLVLYVTFYPMVTSIMWAVFSLTYRIRWEHHHHERFAPHKPSVSILVPAYNEGKLIQKGIQAILQIEYPSYEIIVINDGSTDDTVEQIKPLLANKKIRFLHKAINQGKALALNDAIGIANGEILVVLDADAQPNPDFLHHMTWHFQHARVGAVTGHPRVKNATNFLTRIQIIEFASIIGLLRRSQRIWGRIVTVSGIAAAFRREALADVGGFSPEMYTEDIDITWRLEKRHWDIRYDPRAIVWMHVPDTLRDFFKQRLRWARGLLQVLRAHSGVVKGWKTRRMWPMYIESCLSTLWNTAYGVILIIELGIFQYTSPFFSPYYVWTILMATVCLGQLLIGALIERKHDKDVLRYFGYAIFYPLFYWVFMFIVTWAALPVLWRKAGRIVKWSSDRH